ncbi:MEDS domain-containing protein, partial [Candidatus Bipolaricaulota bacterium]|nr:MEDS domain-containing protein [Candidatus Bipolaricaulota bacterium]
MNVPKFDSSKNSPIELTDLQPGDHLCFIHENETQHKNVLTPFIKEGLEANQKVVYILDSSTKEEIIGYLENLKQSPEKYLNGGQLVFRNWDQFIKKDGASS